ncbi:hypothetical protein H6503_01730 [Candidatus Woesearchaeota archaeon]|nr:hypothetical protein [Candidatus Woesearchaeota archaeon]
MITLKNMIGGNAKRTKAQAEIVGITIVMVLIMLGIVFVIKYIVLPQDYNIKDAYDKTQTAANFMDAVMKTTTKCNTLTITELIQDCAERYGTEFLYNCPEDTMAGICPGGCDSCTYLNASLEHILENSLDEMPQVHYDLYVCRWNHANGECFDLVEGDMISYFPMHDCQDGSRWTKGYEAKRLAIPTDVGNRVMQMYIC